ncbi:P-loop ATPase, Sll1717 family [Streptomyces sp. NPDC006602]|uniref:P-loop ATPase, Sll1717 family n=1 Tax=Streptomyces sp. NPDC006602 TaxID=3364751 RepID=UPI003680A502
MDEPLLARLHFGRDDAERDARDGRGLLLRGGFLPNAAHDAAVSGRKMLIIGRKGSGKSAVCMRLMADGTDRPGRVLVTPDDAAGEQLRRFELEGLPGASAKALIWRYVFALHAARFLVAHAEDAHDRRPAAVRALRRFLKKNGELPDASGAQLGSRLAQSARGLQTSLSLEAFGVKAGLDLAQSPSEGAHAGGQLEVVERGVAQAFAELGCDTAHEPLLLMVDQLEQVWSAEPDSDSMVIGLLLAARHGASVYGRFARFLLFLRSDIYDSLSFGEGDKYRGDELRISWTRQALRDLAMARARASAGPELTEQRLWREVFPPEVDGEEIAEYLFRRCLPRPRDAIQFLNRCLDTARETPGRDRITEADVRQAGRLFSAWKLKDLSQEYLVAHPFLANLFPLFQNAGYVVTRAVLTERFEGARETLHGRFPAYAGTLTPTGIVDVLHAVGFLGVRRGNDVVFAGDDALPAQPHETEFHIHPCFREAIGATDAIHLWPYEPLVARDRIVQARGFGSIVFGRSARNRDDSLLDELRRSCRSVLSQVDRAVLLTPDVRSMIRERIEHVLDDVGCIPHDAGSMDMEGHLLSTARYFASFAAQLRASGLDDGAGGVGGVARRLDEEARRLRGVAGGSYGSLT